MYNKHNILKYILVEDTAIEYPYIIFQSYQYVVFSPLSSSSGINNKNFNICFVKLIEKY